MTAAVRGAATPTQTPATPPEPSYVDLGARLVQAGLEPAEAANLVAYMRQTTDAAVHAAVSAAVAALNAAHKRQRDAIHAEIHRMPASLFNRLRRDQVLARLSGWTGR